MKQLAGHEKVFKGVMIGKYSEGDEVQLSKDLKRHVKGEVIFFCVGTDRYTGDSLAPSSSRHRRTSLTLR